MNSFDYRYMVYNTRKKEFQFMRICETTKQGAEKLFHSLIGNDALKWRFQTRKVTKQEAEKIKLEHSKGYKIKTLSELLPEINIDEIKEIIKENDKRGAKKCKTKEIFSN